MRFNNLFMDRNKQHQFFDTYKEFFSQYTNDGYTVIHFSISSKSSSCNNNANMAANEMENVYVIDSLSLSSGQGIQILKAIDLMKEGKDIKPIPCSDSPDHSTVLHEIVDQLKQIVFKMK